MILSSSSRTLIKKVDNIGGGLSYVAKGGKLYVCDNTLKSSDADFTVSDGTATYREETLNFTYMNFGHLARYYGTNAVLSSTVIDITKDKLLLTRYGAKDENVLATYEIERINPAEAIPSTITGTVDAGGAEKTLTEGATVTISNSGTLKNATIDASLGKVKLGGLTLTGKMTFNADGKVGVKAGDTVKIVDGTTNTFLQKKALSASDSSYTVSITNNTTAKSDDVTFNFDPIYEGDVMFRVNITNVPDSADLSASYK